MTPPRINPKANVVLAVDPGDVHVGFAVFDSIGGWACTHVQELTPEQYVRTLLRYLRSGDSLQIVMEDWRLYGDKALAQTGSQFGAVRLIGWTYWTLFSLGATTGYVEQPAAFKRPTLGWAKANGYRFRSVQEKTGGHAKDAETHGLYHLVNTRKERVIG